MSLVETLAVDPIAVFKKIMSANPKGSEAEWKAQFHAIIIKQRLQRAANDELADHLLRDISGVSGFTVEGRVINAREQSNSRTGDDISPAEKQARRLESEARRVRREAEAVAFVEKRFAMRIATSCTMDELWRITGAGRKLGKKGDTRLAIDVLGREKLEKAGIGVNE